MNLPIHTHERIYRNQLHRLHRVHPKGPLNLVTFADPSTPLLTSSDPSPHRRMELTRFRGRLTRPNFGAEVAHEIESESAVRRERRVFSAEFKAEAVRLVAERRAEGATLAQIGRELDVRPDQLRAWARQQRRDERWRRGVPGETMEQENRRLRREIAVLRQEQAFAKKVAVYFAKESR